MRFKGSAVIAIKHGETVTIGADTALTGGDMLYMNACSKFFTRDGLTIAVAGNKAILDFLQYQFEVPIPDVDSVNVIAGDYMYGVVVPGLKEQFGKTGMWSLEFGCWTEEYEAPNIIIIHKGNIYELDALLSPTETVFCANGIGSEFAYGMYTSYKKAQMSDLNIYRDDRTFIADCLVEISKHFNSVRPDFDIQEV